MVGVSVTVYDKVASGEGAVHESLVSDVECYFHTVECACEIALTMERCKGECVSVVSVGMLNISLNGLGGAG